MFRDSFISPKIIMSPIIGKKYGKIYTYIYLISKTVNIVIVTNVAVP